MAMLPVACGSRRGPGALAGQRLSGENGRGRQRAELLGSQGQGHIFGVGPGLHQVFGDADALFGREAGYDGQHPAQGYGNIVNVVHQANGFSRERHGYPRMLKCRFHCRGKAGKKKVERWTGGNYKIRRRPFQAQAGKYTGNEFTRADGCRKVWL